MNTENSSAPLLPAPAGRTDGATQQEWLIDVQRSTLGFSLRHIVVQRIQGRFDRWGGSLFFDRAQPSQSSLEIWVDLASITTGDDERDTHVRSAEFLDVTRFPRAKFSSGVVEVRGSDVIVNGRLELHGVVHDVQVNVEIGAPVTGSDGRVRTPATARAALNRQSFGLHWNQDLDIGGIVVGDEIDIRATVELVRTNEPGAPPRT
ncbi:MAG: YceI family protein [Haliangium ochraceum]